MSTLLLLGLGVLSALGVYALAQIASSGSQADWGYVAAAEAFVLSSLAAAPPLAFASRLGRGVWGVSARRLADLCALSALVILPMDVLLVRHLPDWHGRPGIWLDWPAAPGVWHTLGPALLVAAGLALLGCTSLPDTRWRVGSPQQWYVVALAAKALGALYLMALVFVHLLVTSDLGMSLVPGWQSANFPAYHAVSALEGGVATTVVGLAVLRGPGGLGERVPRTVFHACAKLLLALALLWFYFSWAEFLTYWYGRTPAEQDLIALLMFGSSRVLYVGAALGTFVLPVALLIWNPIRASVRGATVAAALILVGTLLDRVRVYASAWTVAGPVSERMAVVPPLVPPSLPDVLILLGAPAVSVLLVSLAARVIPPLSGWEEREAALLRREQPYLRTRVAVIGKPS